LVLTHSVYWMHLLARVCLYVYRLNGLWLMFCILANVENNEPT